MTNVLLVFGNTHLNFCAEPFAAKESGPYPKCPPTPAVANASGDSFPPFLALGSDGTLYLGTSSDHETPLRSTAGRRVFVGVCHQDHSTFVGALREFMASNEPRVYGSDGRVYVECVTAEDIAEAQKGGHPMIWAYAARGTEEERILEELCFHAYDITLRLNG